jgi:hypothetical protein
MSPSSSPLSNDEADTHQPLTEPLLFHSSHLPLPIHDQVRFWPIAPNSMNCQFRIKVRKERSYGVYDHQWLVELSLAEDVGWVCGLGFRLGGL